MRVRATSTSHLVSEYPTAMMRVRSLFPEPAMHRPVLYINDRLAWADAFRKRVGRWPNRHDGEVLGRDVTWEGMREEGVGSRE